MVDWIRFSLTKDPVVVQNQKGSAAPADCFTASSGSSLRPPRPMDCLRMRSLQFSAVLTLLAFGSATAFARPLHPALSRRVHRPPVRAVHTHVPVAHIAAAPIARVAIRRTAVAATVATGASLRAVRPKPAPIVRGGPWFEPTYADSTVGDNVDGEDLDVRRAAVEALGRFNGSVVAVD